MNGNVDVFSITTNHHMEMEKNSNVNPDKSSFIPQLKERHFLIKCKCFSTEIFFFDCYCIKSVAIELDLQS